MNIHTQGRITPANRPRKPKGSVSALPAGIVEPEALQALRRLRQEAQAEIDRLIAFLDATDIDPDLEMPGDDEPNLGWTSAEAAYGGYRASLDDREEEHDGREPDVDDDLSSGWDNEGSQKILRADDDQEPSLGWTEHVNQSTRGMLVPGWLVEDGEEECEDEGAQVDAEREEAPL